MKISIVACVASFVAALVVGVVCLVLFLVGLSGDVSEITGVYQSPFIYAGLPAVILLGVSMAFAHWNLLAARVFAIVSGVIFFGYVICFYATVTRTLRWGEVIGFSIMATLSLLANWYIASLVRRQLDRATPNSAVNSDAARQGAQRRLPLR